MYRFFVGLFVYYNYWSNETGRAFEALIRLAWISCSFTIMMILLKAISWFEWTRNKNELLTATICVTAEAILLFPALIVALLSDMTVVNKSVGKSRRPWNSLSRVN